MHLMEVEEEVLADEKKERHSTTTAFKTMKTMGEQQRMSKPPEENPFVSFEEKDQAMQQMLKSEVEIPAGEEAMIG